MPCFAVSLKSK